MATNSLVNRHFLYFSCIRIISWSYGLQVLQLGKTHASRNYCWCQVRTCLTLYTSRTTWCRVVKLAFFFWGDLHWEDQLLVLRSLLSHLGNIEIIWATLTVQPCPTLHSLSRKWSYLLLWMRCCPAIY